MKNYSGEDKQEMIKALAAGMPIMDIANFADTTEEEIEEFAKKHKKEIEECKKVMEE